MELVERGYNPAVQDSNGQAPLIWAIDNGHDTLVQLLLTEELDINAFDTLKRTAFILELS